jgi:pimeloyl-ACP methyl ester carboxylesterase
MTGLTWPTVRRLCSIFCCPPCPSKIAAKLAFLPPIPTYSIVDELGKKKLLLREEAEWQYTQRELEYFEPFVLRTSRAQTIACLYVHCSPSAKYTILFSHGNAVDIGHMTSFLIGLGLRLKCNIVTYDYSGYGCSTGTPSETNLYSDIEAVWNSLSKRYGISASNVILYGQSIGTAPTIDLASRYEVGGVVLHSPLTSGLRLAFPDTKRTWCCDAFPSIDKVTKITSVVLVIHGTEDEVIDFSHGQLIYQRCPRAVEPLWVDGAGHNDIELYPQYIERLSRFIEQELSVS